MNIGRNEPCPCGSGRKYKRCCLAGKPSEDPAVPPTARFRFENGSYGGNGRYMPSVLCYEQVTADEWREHFCLVNPKHVFGIEGSASAQAEADLNDATSIKSSGGSDTDFAMSLKRKGYIQVEDFRRAND